MKKLTRDDLYSLEQYAEERAAFRKKVMAHKLNRRIDLGEHLSLHFEDRLVMQYQIQEILRTEKIFEADGIKEELEAYNPLIPDGSNLKATMMIQYPDVEERKLALERLLGVENKVWVQADGHEKVYPIADEDLERETEEKTSAVHFLRFEFSEDMINALQAGAELSAGVDHSEMEITVSPLDKNIRDSLVSDFD